VSATNLALVVDDDPDIRRLIRRYLEKMFFTVEEAATGKAVLAALEGHKPALVCLDLMLPDCSGYEICERIRSTPRLCDLPVLIVSGRSMPSDRAFAEEVGADGYLVKPIRWDSFSAAVNEVVRGGERVRAAS